jgi:FMN reductase
VSARVAVVVGNPEPASRTLDAATYLATELSGQAPDLVVVASPTYKATYSGLLKLFLDRFAPQRGTGLRGTAVPLMLGAGPGHALAPELTLRPVLAEIGAPVSLRGLYVVDSAYDDPAAYAEWLATTRPVARALLASSTGVPS